VVGAGRAAFTPLTLATYYGRWSKHLAFGYYDQPPVSRWWIRLGTIMAATSDLGVRLRRSCLARRDWAIYRAAAILFRHPARVGERGHPAQRHA